MRKEQIPPSMEEFLSGKAALVYVLPRRLSKVRIIGCKTKKAEEQFDCVLQCGTVPKGPGTMMLLVKVVGDNGKQRTLVRATDPHAFDILFDPSDRSLSTLPRERLNPWEIKFPGNWIAMLKERLTERMMSIYGGQVSLSCG